MKQSFRVTVDSPYGKQPVEQFKKHLMDMASESLERWGISITVESLDDSDDVDRSEFE